MDHYFLEEVGEMGNFIVQEKKIPLLGCACFFFLCGQKLVFFSFLHGNFIAVQEFFWKMPPLPSPSLKKTFPSLAKF